MGKLGWLLGFGLFAEMTGSCLRIIVDWCPFAASEETTGLRLQGLLHPRKAQKKVGSRFDV